jgi:hypothetical protein
MDDKVDAKSSVDKDAAPTTKSQGSMNYDGYGRPSVVPFDQSFVRDDIMSPALREAIAKEKQKSSESSKSASTPVSQQTPATAPPPQAKPRETMYENPDDARPTGNIFVS